MNKMVTKIEEADEAGNNKEIYYWYGRFANLFLVFDPVESTDIDSLDDDDFDNFMAFSPSVAVGGKSEKRLKAKMARQSAINLFVKDPKVVGLFGNSYAFANGFINASFGDASPNSKICQTNITRIITHGKAFEEQVKNGTNAELQLAAFSFENILGSVHPIAFSCYESVYDFGSTGDYYMDTFSDFSKVTYNLIHKLGAIYDTIFYLTRHQEKYGDLDELTEAEQMNWFFKLGIYYGTATFLVFYTPTEIDPYDPMEEYTGLENGDHLDDEDKTDEATE